MASATAGAATGAARAAVGGLSLERLSRIDRHLQERYIDAGRITGAVTVVARRGGVAHFSALGLMDREREKAMAEDTVFRIYSMTKPITAVALMTLYEEGRFQLDRPVHRLIPEWEGLGVYESGEYPDIKTVPPERPMVIGDLLSHTAGLTYGGAIGSPVDRAYTKAGVNPGRNGTLREMAQALAGMPLEYSPGTRWKYSLATDVAGHLVELLSGQPLDQFFRERIFEPLGMSDTGFNVSDEQMPRFAANYRRAPDRSLELIDDPEKSAYRTPPTFFSGGGGLVSTAGDYLRFCQMLVNGGELDGARILSRKTIALMAVNRLPGGHDLTEVAIGGFSETTNAGIGFGLGMAVHIDQARSGLAESVGSFYWGGAASTIFWIDPVEDLVAIFMTQLMPSNTFDFRRQLSALVYSSIVD